MHTYFIIAWNLSYIKSATHKAHFSRYYDLSWECEPRNHAKCGKFGHRGVSSQYRFHLYHIWTKQSLLWAELRVSGIQMRMRCGTKQSAMRLFCFSNNGDIFKKIFSAPRIIPCNVHSKVIYSWGHFNLILLNQVDTMRAVSQRSRSKTVLSFAINTFKEKILLTWFVCSKMTVKNIRRYAHGPLRYQSYDTTPTARAIVLIFLDFWEETTAVSLHGPTWYLLYYRCLLIY